MSYEKPEIFVYEKENALMWATPKTGCAPLGLLEIIRNGSVDSAVCKGSSCKCTNSQSKA